MDPTQVLALLSNAVTLMQGIAAATESYDRVATIINKRVADGRLHWTKEETTAIMDAMIDARGAAIREVGKLPDGN